MKFKNFICLLLFCCCLSGTLEVADQKENLGLWKVYSLQLVNFSKFCSVAMSWFWGVSVVV